MSDENNSLRSSNSDKNSENNSDNNFEDITDVTDDISNCEDYKIDMEELDRNLPETVTLLTLPNGVKVYLIGTAHFSVESQNDVSKVIRAVQPQCVMVELCSSRINILRLDEATLLEEAKNINLEKITTTIRQSGVFNGIMYILLLSMSAHLTKELGMAPGGEFRRAFQEAMKIHNCVIHLGDRPIQITLQRALARLSWIQTFKLGWHLLTSTEPISKEDVEKCKRRDMLEELLAEMTGEFPALGEVFVNERDLYLTYFLQSLAEPHKNDNGDLVQYDRIVGVVGIGHVAGIVRLFPERQVDNVEKIITIPPPTLTSKVVKITFKLSLLTFGGYLLYKYVPATKKFTDSCGTVFRRILKV